MFYKFAHSVVNWTVVVINYGPQIAENVTVKNLIPVGLINVNVVPNDGGSFVGCVWSVGDLANGANATLIINTMVNAINTTVVNKVRMTSDTYDPNLDNKNDSNKTVVVVFEADL